MYNLFSRSVILIGIVMTFSCTQQSEATLPPDDILINLIYDLHLAEASMNRVHAARQDSVADILRERIAASYGITPYEMDTWLEMLQKSPDHLITVYDSVIARYEKSTTK